MTKKENKSKHDHVDQEAKKMTTKVSGILTCILTSGFVFRDDTVNLNNGYWVY